MDETFIPGSQTAALQSLLAGMDAYLEAFPTVAEGLAASDQVAEARGLERLNRLSGAVFHPLIRVWGEQRIPDLVGTKTVGQALQLVLNLSPAEAGARVRASEKLGTRWAITGEVLEPQYPLAAAAAKTGDLSSEHTKVQGAPKVQLTIIMSEQAVATGKGLAGTGDGQYLSAKDALALSDQAITTAVVHTATGGIQDYGTRRRGASDGQRAAILSRDRGCSFPGCTAPPAWAEIHHIRPWQNGGPTNLDNLVAVCGFHHRAIERLGWTCEIRDKLPYWIPPALVDPDRTPRHNRHWLVEHL